MEKTKFEGSLGLWFVHLRLFIAEIEDIHQVLDGFAGIVSLRVCLSKKFVSFNLCLTIASLFCKFEEAFTVLNSLIKLTLSLINHTDLLEALSLHVLILDLLRSIEALLIELERHIEFVVLKVLLCNRLIYFDQVL